ncbi:MAG: tRNA adenosine(34) deaminase TadA [Porticoccaceae bacterium]|nr:tRNA adenosine(34) deaminase TadA [Porticoccaceae bacterium]
MADNLVDVESSSLNQSPTTLNEQAAQDAQWMARALILAERAEAEGEVPVGALVVRDKELLGEGWNSAITNTDPTAHAELCALRAGALAADNYRLPGATLYVTLEPCAMCVGAMIHARIARLVFATREPRAGAVLSQLSLLDLGHFNHRIEWQSGVLAEPASIMLREFFRRRRQAKK